MNKKTNNYQKSQNSETSKCEENRHFITRRVSKYSVEKIYVSDKDYCQWNSFVNTHRKRAQRCGDCLCPKEKLWQCDTVCSDCPFFNCYKYDRLDDPQFANDESECPETKVDYIADPSTENMEERIIMQLTIECLIEELNEKEPALGLILSSLYDEIKTNTFTNLSELYKKLKSPKSSFFDNIARIKKIMEEKGLKK